MNNLKYSDLISFHQQKNNLATVVCTQVENIQEKGMVIFDNNNQIINFKEKPAKEEIVSNYANGGIYIFNTRI